MTKQLTDEELRELAERTIDWLQEQGAVRTPQGILTFAVLKGKNGWCEEMKESEGTFRLVKAWLIKKDRAIAVEPFKGHNLGEDGDQASNIALLFSHALSELSTAKTILEYARWTGSWLKVSHVLSKLLPPGITVGHITSLLDTIDNIGIRQLSLVTLMLKDNSEATD